MAHLLVFTHASCETPGLLAEVARERGHALETVRFFENESIPAPLGSYGALIVMGGPMGVYEEERHPHLVAEKKAIREFIQSGRPVIGICLGSQLIASALGSRVYPGTAKEIGWRPVTVMDSAGDDPLFGALPNTFTAFHWHGDVFDLPAGAIPLARTAQTALQAFRYRPGVYGILFHLEVTPALVAGFISNFGGELQATGQSIGRVEDETRSLISESGKRGRAVFERWLDYVAP